MSIEDAPSVVMIVGFIFLLAATIAYIGAEYQESFPADETGSVQNETLTTVAEGGEAVAGASQCNFEDFTVTNVYNATDNASISSGNYTTTSTGVVAFASGGDTNFNNTNWAVSYTYSYTGIACNVTTNLNTELEDNTSIIGVVLTIALVGIILSILIGIFMMARKRGL